jgi:predicted membrane protein
MNENKFKSRKFVITIWAAAMFSILGIGFLITNDNPDWSGACMPILLTIILAYIGGQSYIDSKK